MNTLFLFNQEQNVPIWFHKRINPIKEHLSLIGTNNSQFCTKELFRGTLVPIYYKQELFVPKKQNLGPIYVL